MAAIERESPPEAAARALAFVVAANGHVDERELHQLDALHAYERLGVTRERFVELAQDTVQRVGDHLTERPWLSVDDRQALGAALDAVTDPVQRLLVCRFAAAVVTADGIVSASERSVYDFTLAHWHIAQDRVRQAILEDHPPLSGHMEPI